MNPTKEDIEEQLNKIFDNLNSVYATSISFILSQLDFNLKYEKQFSKESIIKLYLFKRIKGFHRYEQLEDYFNKNAREAFLLGFINDVNNNLIFPKKRTFNEYLEEFDRNELDKIAELIIIVATKRKKILDLDVVKKAITKKIDNRQELRETTSLIKKLIYPNIEIMINHNAKFDTRDLLDILVHVAQTHDFCNNGSLTFKELNQEIKVPSGDTIMYHFNKFSSVEEIEYTFERIFDLIFNFAKQNYRLLRERKVNLAIDVHDIPYYGDKSDDYVIGGKQDRGTCNFFRFITCAIVISGKRFTIGAIPVHPFDRLEELVDRLIKKAKSKVSIRHVYLDRGFNRANVINILKENKVNFIMPMVRNVNVKQWFDKSEDNISRVIKDFNLGDSIVNLVLVNDSDGIKRAFATNLDIPEQLAHHLYSWYSKRWGIETSYRNLEHDFKPRTTSKNYLIRLFYFLFSVCLYNLWVLVNICVSLKLYGRILDKPVITAKLFAIVLYRTQIELVDPG